MGQTFGAATQGQMAFSPLLAKEVADVAQPQMKFVQFCEIKEEWGKGMGDTWKFDKFGNIDTQGGRLTETTTIPAHGYAITQGTGTLYELGNSIPFTRKYEDLSQIDVRRAPAKKLGDDYAKVSDTSAEAEFDLCKVRYVGTGTGGGAFTTNGTATLTCTSQLNLYHTKQMADYMFQTLNCEPWDGDHYMLIGSTDAIRGVYDEVEDILQYTKFPSAGEVGKYYNVRFVKTNHGLSNAMGASSAYGEAYMFGDNGPPVMRGVAVPMDTIPKEETDYRRSRGLAWYSVEGYKLYWEGDPDNSIIKFGSA